METNDSHLWSCVCYYQFLTLYNKGSLQSNHICKFGIFHCVCNLLFILIHRSHLLKSLHFILAQSWNFIIATMCRLKSSWKEQNWNAITLLKERGEKSRLTLSILERVDRLLMSQMGSLIIYWYEVVYQPSTAQLLSDLGNCVFDYRRELPALIKSLWGWLRQLIW